MSMRAATVLCWIVAFLLGSVPVGHFLERSRLRRDLRRLEGGRRAAAVDLRALLGGGVVDPAAALPSATEVAGAVFDTGKVLGLALGALVVVRRASPSDFGVLPPWELAALWAGLAAGVGHLWSMWLGFRSAGQAQAPLLALAVRFTPTAFVVAVTGYVVGRVGAGQRVAVVISLVGFVGWTWAAWVWDLPHWWGFAWGPELAVWVGVTAGVVAARNL